MPVHDMDTFRKAFALVQRAIGVDLRYALSSGLWLNLGSAVTILGAFVVSVAFANLLPKESFGTYQYLLSILALLSAFTLTGMNAAITRAVAQGDDGALRASIRPQIAWNSFSALAALAISAYYLLNGDLRLGLGSACVALALPLITTFNSYGAFLVGKKAFRTHFVFTSLASVAYTVTIVVALLFFPAVLPLVAVNLAFTALAPIALYLLTVRAYRLPARARDPDTLSYGKHLSLMNLFGTVSYQIDTFLVFHVLGPVALATYSMATLIPERLGGMLKNVTNAMLPRFAEQPVARIREGIVRKTVLFSALVGALAAGYALAAPFFFSLVYPQYLDAVPYTQAFALTLFIGVGNFVGAALLAHRKVRALYLLNTVTPVVNVAFVAAGLLLGGLWGIVLGRIIAGAAFVLLTLPIAFVSLRRSPNGF